MSKELGKTYDPKDIEDRLYKKWEDNGYFHAEVNPDKKPFTIVMPPPNVLDIDAHFLFRQIAQMSHRSLDDIVRTEIFSDRLCLGRGLHDD